MASAGAAAVSMVPFCQAFAQTGGGNPGDRELIRIAREEVARAGDSLAYRDVVGLADFGRHSGVARFHVINLEDGRIQSFLVAHGTGSDPQNTGWLTHFSGMVRSNATSRGAFVSQEVFDGQYGPSVRLGGLDRDNSNAELRGIVVCGADYSTEGYLARSGRLGRSRGSFALSPPEFQMVSRTLSGGRLVFADCLNIAQG